MRSSISVKSWKPQGEHGCPITTPESRIEASSANSIRSNTKTMSPWKDLTATERWSNSINQRQDSSITSFTSSVINTMTPNGEFPQLSNLNQQTESPGKSDAAFLSSTVLEQLVSEVKSIYVALVMVEAKCLEVCQSQSTRAYQDGLNSDQWHALIALYPSAKHNLSIA